MPRLRSILARLKYLPFLLAVLAWSASYFWGAFVGFDHGTSSSYGALRLGCGLYWYEARPIFGHGPFAGVDHAVGGRFYDVDDIEREYAVRMSAKLGGFAWGQFLHELRRPNGPPKFVKHVVVQVPLWPIVLLLAISPTRAVIRVARDSVAQGRAARGACPFCGYDLRATPERCPECGTIPAR